MDHALICSWLGLPPDGWPPDHYALLGLPAGESDIQKIEEHVHDRLLTVRQYQLNHPDQATEAMNRLAQAFTCLTDPEAKRTYDAALLLHQPATPAAVEEPALVISVDEPDPLAWLFGPWGQLAPPPDVGADEAFPVPPLRTEDWAKQPPPPRLAPRAGTAAPNGMPAPAGETPVPTAEPADHIIEAARASRLARRGLGTARALYHRIAVTRQLLWHWRQVGQYLGYPERRLTRIAQATELVRNLGAILELLPDFPPLLGRADQPGYLVIALARQQLIIPTFRALKPEQREVLAQRWRDGLKLLTAHRQLLRAELKGLRKKGFFGRATRAVRAFITDQPEAILLLIALVAVNIVLWGHFGR
jgi:hypothetical protein